MNDTLTQRLRFCSTLPSLPAIAVKIIDLANDPDADISMVCQFISLDPALAAKMLRLANSPLYKTRRETTNLRQAISVLGTHAVVVTALSFSLANSLMKQTGQYPTAFDSNSFWRQSIASALASRALGEKLGLNIPDDLFLAGLLQDIGILAYSAMMPEEYGPVFASTSDHDLLLKAEREIFGAGHDEAGYALLKKWGIPDYISTCCIASHGQPVPIEIGSSLNACVAVSRYVADYFLNPGESGKVTTVMDMAQSWLNMNGSTLKEVIDIMAAGLSSVEDLFEISIHSPIEISGILCEAKELLMIQALSKAHELEEKSQRDSLTGASNRGFFDETLKREFYLSVQYVLPLTVAMIDLDHFKDINDKHGHLVGDAILVEVVKTILGKIRQDDTLSRYGGEEFVLILPGTTIALARKLMIRLKDSIAGISYKLEDNRSINVTASIGVASNMDGTTQFDNPADLIKAVDFALYAAKHAGRNKIVEWNTSLSAKQ